MIGILVILTISFALLYLFERKLTDALGLIPYPKHILAFFKGLIFIALVKLFIIYIETIVKSFEWTLNNPLNVKLIFEAAWYHLKSALTEELLFRGALLYILFRKLGMQKAIIISAMAFGVYHWFSYGMFGAGIIPMAYVFLITGLMGYVWAYTFVKTKSIMLPLGCHFGWNLLQACFYTSQPFGQLVFTETSKATISDLHNFYFSLFSGLFPSVITFLFVKFMVKSPATPGLQSDPFATA